MNHDRPILVIGGTGKTGRRIIAGLQALGFAYRVASRTAAQPFVWERPETWPTVLTGVDTVYVAYFPDLACEGAYEVMVEFSAAAKAAGVKRLVLLSGRGEPEAQRCEALFSDFQWFVVRAAWFNQNFNEGYFQHAIAAGCLRLPVADVPEPFIDADDIAEVALKLLTEEGHDSRVYEITGPRALTFSEIVAEISAALERPIQFDAIDKATYVAEMTSIGVPESVIQLTLYLYSEVLDGRNQQPTDTVQELLGRPARDFRDYARQAAAQGAWNSNPVASEVVQ